MPRKAGKTKPRYIYAFSRRSLIGDASSRGYCNGYAAFPLQKLPVFAGVAAWLQNREEQQ